MTDLQQQTAAAAARPGWKTSEFWLSIIGIAGTLFAPALDNLTSGATDQLSSHGVGGAIAAGAIVGAYTVARGLVKAAGVKAATTPVVTAARSFDPLANTTAARSFDPLANTILPPAK